MIEEQEKLKEFFNEEFINNIENLKNELGQSKVRYDMAISFLKFKKLHPTLSKEEFENVLIDKYGNDKALQVISDAEKILNQVVEKHEVPKL